MKRNLKSALIYLMLPSVLIISSFILIVILNLIFNPTFWMVPDGEPVNTTPITITVMNWALLTTGTIGLLTLLPGIIIGLTLMRRNNRSS